jgi:hypothetical protein
VADYLDDRHPELAYQATVLRSGLTVRWDDDYRLWPVLSTQWEPYSRVLILLWTGVPIVQARFTGGMNWWHLSNWPLAKNSTAAEHLRRGLGLYLRKGEWAPWSDWMCRAVQEHTHHWLACYDRVAPSP